VLALDTLGERCNAFGVGNVHGDGFETGVVAYGIVELPLWYAGYDYFIAEREKRAGEPKAYSGAATSNQHRIMFEVHSKKLEHFSCPRRPSPALRGFERD
jgi:hypothetical protein